jgi:hypothetical protein
MNRILTLLLFLGLLGTSPLFSQDPEFKTTSILAGGTIHRIGVTESGVYKLDYNFIKDKLKLEPSSISPDRIIIAGNGAGRIPQWSGAPRVDDLEQIATMGVGLEDGRFDSGDYLFGMPKDLNPGDLIQSAMFISWIKTSMIISIIIMS